jgi:hypothetical protein
MLQLPIAPRLTQPNLVPNLERAERYSREPKTIKHLSNFENQFGSITLGTDYSPRVTLSGMFHFREFKHSSQVEAIGKKNRREQGY